MVGRMAELGAVEQRQLLEDLNYLNLQELRSICERHGIPHRILVETADGRMKATRDTDRKPVVLGRIRQWLATGEVLGATCLPARIVRRGGPPAELQPGDRLYYRWYNRTYGPVMRLLKDMTGGRFDDGALARVLVMEFWTGGEAPTFQQFADAWLAAMDEPRNLLSADYAFLTDRRRGGAGPDWKAKRQQRAGRALATLADLEGLELSTP